MLLCICLTGVVYVTHFTQHRGHDLDVAHLTLRKEQREQIAGQLAVGIPFEDVLDSVQWSTPPTGQVTALNLITRRYLHSIAMRFGVSRREVLHKDDAQSVAAWVEHTKTSPFGQNQVRYVKFQGEAGQFGLGEQDFMLVIMNDIQVAWLKHFGGPMKEVALDSTHGTNEYNFQLTTLLVVDDHGEGLPAAFCYSNRVDECAIAVFLSAVKEALGKPLRDVILMTDDAEAYSNAWHLVMGQPAHRLLCSWHIDRAWRKNLGKIAGDTLLKDEVYKTLRTLMELSDKEVFAERLAQFLEIGKADQRTAEFVAYFEKEYACRPALWAYSYRIGLRVHHNMHLEALHRVLKHVHLQGRKVKRMDKSIHALLKLLRAKMSDRLLKIHKGKWTKHLSGIRKRHAASTTLDASMCTCLEENTRFLVKGSGQEYYMVEQSDSLPHPKKTCPLMCRECNVCMHAFSCSCLDSALRSTICKHVHLVVSTFKPQLKVCAAAAEPSHAQSDPTEPSHAQSDPAEPSHAQSDPLLDIDASSGELAEVHETQAILQSVSSAKSIPEKEKLAASARQRITSILAKLETADAECIAAIDDGLAKLQCVICALEQMPSIPRLPASTSCEPANKAITTQRYFSSTRRNKLSLKRKANLAITKPSAAEKLQILQSLGGNTEVINRAPHPDHDYEGDRQCHVVNFEHSYPRPPDHQMLRCRYQYCIVF